MTVVVYKSTDSSAPTLSGTAGDLVNLLDKCLVTGYGAKAAAGWTKPFTGTNAASFRQGGSGFYLDVNDNAPGAATAKEARIRGYEAMTAVATGTSPFPTVAQLAAGCVIRKSTTADGTVRAWILAADDRTFYLFVKTGDGAAVYLATMFGDVYSFLAGDAYKCAIMARGVENSGTPTAASETFGDLRSGFSNQAGHYFVRSYTGFGGAVTAGKVGMADVNSSADPMPWGGSNVFPDQATAGLITCQVRAFESGSARRGALRGIRQPRHRSAGFADGDTFDGVGALAGRSYLIITAGGGTATGATVSFYILETTDWDTSP